MGPCPAAARRGRRVPSRPTFPSPHAPSSIPCTTCTPSAGLRGGYFASAAASTGQHVRRVRVSVAHHAADPRHALKSEIRMQKSRKKLPGAAPASQGDRSACPEHSQSTGKRKKLAVNKHSGVPCKRVPLLAFAAACALPAAKIHGCAHRHSSQVLELLPLTAYFGGARYERRCC